MAEDVNPFLRYDNLKDIEVLRYNFRQLELILYNQTSNNTTADGTATNLTTHEAATNPHSITATTIGLGSVSNIKDKLDATAAPTVNDDSGDGYSERSLWIDVTNDKAYICLDDTVGSAVWTEITQSGGSVSFTSLISVQLTAADVIATSSTVKLDLDSVDYDANSDWDSVNKRWDAPSTGKYMVMANVEWVSNATGQRYAILYVNGAEEVRDGRLRMQASGGYTCPVGVSTVLDLSANDYVEVYVYQNSGGNLNVSDTTSTYLRIFGPITT